MNIVDKKQKHTSSEICTVIHQKLEKESLEQLLRTWTISGKKLTTSFKTPDMIRVTDPSQTD